MKTNFTRTLPIICGVGLALFQSQQVHAAEPNVIPGKSLGRISIGFTTAQVHKALGKPDKTFKLKNGLTDDIYTSKRLSSKNRQSIHHKIEILYKSGQVIQIEATSPIFVTPSGLSTDTSIVVLNKKLNPKRFYVYESPGDDVGGALMYYLDQVESGIAFEYGATQDIWFKDFGSSTLIVHRKGVPVLQDQDWKFYQAYSYVPPDQAELK